MKTINITTTQIIRSLFLVLIMVFTFQSCEQDLELQPEDARLVGDAAFEDASSYKAFLGKLYGGFSLSGQIGPAGLPDLAGLDEGFSNYLRLYWKMQELTTDEAVVGWNDGTIKDLHGQVWTSGNEFIRTMYSRIFYQIAQTNEFLRQTTDEKLTSRSVDAETKSDVASYRAEARFLRALSYWHALDLFGNVPFVTENDAVGAFLPEQISRADLYTYIENELLAVESTIVGARQNEYGRADQAAVWTLLAKLYLNSEVYTESANYDKVVEYTNKIINAGYTISGSNTYEHLFLADNDMNGGQSEFIFTVPCDGLNTQSYGAVSFIIHASLGGSMDPASAGINGGWGGLRTTSALVNKFPDFITPPSFDADAENMTLVKSVEDNNATLGNNMTQWGLVGSSTANGWDGPDMEMYELATNEFALYAELTAGEFKFRFNEDWGQNYGDDGADGSLESGGANIAVAEAGQYYVTLNLNTFEYTISKANLSDWGLVGSSTANGWDGPDMEMYETDTDVYELYANLTAGDIKFRFNEDWGQNYGGSGGNLVAGGDNISIAEDAGYHITMNLNDNSYTINKVELSADSRAMFYTDGQSLEIEDISPFSQGYAITKFKNLDSMGNPGSDTEGNFVDTDFPMFRLSDVYLMYAEAVLRGGGGSLGDAVNYINTLRERAYSSTVGNISGGDVDLDFILDERARELYWEAHRRTDLIRFGQFSDQGIWPWKGNVPQGKTTEAYRDLMPIPSSDLGVNTNLKQNEGYN